MENIKDTNDSVIQFSPKCPVCGGLDCFVCDNSFQYLGPGTGCCAPDPDEEEYFVEACHCKQCDIDFNQYFATQSLLPDQEYSFHE